MKNPPNGRIRQLVVKNYRSLANVNLDMGSLTLLVGPNGAGKSNIIDAFRFIRDAVTRGLENAIIERHGMSALRRWSAKGRPYDVHLEVHLDLPQGQAMYAFTLGSERRGEYRVKWERCEVAGQDGVAEYEIKDGKWIKPINGWQGEIMQAAGELSTPQLNLFLPSALHSRYISVQRFIQDMGFYTIYPNDLSEPQKSSNVYPLEEKGQNLASLLRDSKRKKRPEFQQLLAFLSQAVTGIDNISVTQVGGYLVARLHHGKGGPAFELAQESDGTLRILGILTALYQAPPRTLLAIEEPELTIHPGALGVLGDALLEGSARSQLLITTHSPDLLYQFPADSLRVVEKKEGITVVGKVAEQQRKAIEEKLFSPGELMRMEGLKRA
ncbi:MAG: AAA family ATPase [Proteobacteria bacterium]|nr:AAA family ATPase [Pseudomonadota bacterium]